MFSSISNRMLSLVETKLPKYGRFQELERLTKIKNATWQTWARGRQRPTEKMIEALACLWPEHAYWLATGDELPREGMTNPTKQLNRELQTLRDFTAQTLAMRIAIRDELFAVSALNASEDELGNVADEHISEFVGKFFDRLTETGIELSSLAKEDRTKVLLDAFETKLADAMKGDEQLQALEQTRDKLLVQILGKGNIDSKPRATTK